MLTDVEREALKRWYAKDDVLEQARRLNDAKKDEELEEFLHRTALLPLGRHDELPDYMKNEEGAPLFPTNLSPVTDEKRWQDAIELAWDVMREKLGIAHDDLHRRIAAKQTRDWETFMESVERRKRERGSDSPEKD